MGGDQIVIHVARMGGHVADAQQARDFGKRADKAPKPPIAPVRSRAVIGIHILAEQRDLPRATGDQAARFRNHGGDGTARFRAAGIGHDAEGAELVTALLHGEEGGDGLILARRGFGQEVEFLLDREIGLDHRACGAMRARDHFGQAVIGLRPEHDIDEGSALGDLGAFRLRDAAGHRQDGLLAFGGPLLP